MFTTGQSTAVTTSTNLKRNYKNIKDMLKKNMIVLVTNKNSEDAVDGVFIPYSKLLMERIEDFMEDLEMEENREELEKELEESLKSGGGKRIKAKDIIIR